MINVRSVFTLILSATFVLGMVYLNRDFCFDRADQNKDEGEAAEEDVRRERKNDNSIVFESNDECEDGDFSEEDKESEDICGKKDSKSSESNCFIPVPENLLCTLVTNQKHSSIFESIESIRKNWQNVSSFAERELKKSRKTHFRVLLTGGAGFIGSHTLVLLLERGYHVTVLDNLSNGSVDVLSHVCKITGTCIKSEILHFQEIDLLDITKLDRFLRGVDKFDFCIHFAGLKSVGESEQSPLKYYDNNVTGTLNLLRVLERYNCKNFIFSSSATVYGSQEAPFDESMITGVGITNAYGRSKYVVEEILKDFFQAKKRECGQEQDKKTHKQTQTEPRQVGWNIVILRYFNPAGAHSSGFIGETPLGVPQNLVPFLTQFFAGKREKFVIHGVDYDTKDGFCMRDFIHVMDLAEGHLKTLEFILKNASLEQVEVFNLGSGTPISVLEMFRTMQKISGEKKFYSVGRRRPGDVAVSLASVEKANRVLGWKTTKTIEDMCRDAWNWEKHRETIF